MVIDKLIQKIPSTTRIIDSFGNTMDFSRSRSVAIEYNDFKKISDFFNKPHNSTDIVGTLYVSKLCEIDRSEIKDWCLEQGIPKTNRHEKASTHIHSKSFFDSMKEFFNISNSSWETYYYYSSCFTHEDRSKKGKPYKVLTYLYYHHTIRGLLNKISDSKVTIGKNNIFEENLLPTIKDSKGIELNDEFLKTLNEMFSSKEQDNIDMGLDLLSNIPIHPDNIAIIALFLNSHRDKFKWGSGLSLKNKRFKPTRIYMSQLGIQPLQTFPKVLKSVKNLDGFTNKQEILGTALKNYINALVNDDIVKDLKVNV